MARFLLRHSVIKTTQNKQHKQIVKMKKTGIIFETNFHTLEDAQNKAEALNKEFPEYSFIGADTGNDFVIIKEDEISLTN